MSIGNQNEVTVKITCSKEELEEKLKKQGFEKLHIYNSTDIYLIPKETDIYKEKTRDILSKAILLRKSEGINVNKHRERITFKSKDINDDGKILSQYSVNCDVDNIKDAKEIFEYIGYKELMKIDEEHISYIKDNLKIVIKARRDMILIEIETNEVYKDVESLEKAINELDIPFDHSNYYVKKAEEELEKIKKNR